MKFKAFEQLENGFAVNFDDFRNRLAQLFLADDRIILVNKDLFNASHVIFVYIGR